MIPSLDSPGRPKSLITGKIDCNHRSVTVHFAASHVFLFLGGCACETTDSYIYHHKWYEHSCKFSATVQVDFDDIMLTNVYIFLTFFYTYTCNDMRSVMLQINEYDDDLLLVSNA